MIKAGALSVWVLLVLGLSTYFFSMGGLPKPPVDENVVEEQLTEVGSMSVPMVRDHQIRGYLLLNMSVGADARRKIHSLIPLDVIARDAVISAIYNNPDIDVFQLEKLDLEKLKGEILAKMNEGLKAGEEVALKVYLSEIHFIGIEDIRARKGSHL